MFPVDVTSLVATKKWDGRGIHGRAVVMWQSIIRTFDLVLGWWWCGDSGVVDGRDVVPDTD